MGSIKIIFLAFKKQTKINLITFIIVIPPPISVLDYLKAFVKFKYVYGGGGILKSTLVFFFTNPLSLDQT